MIKRIAVYSHDYFIDGGWMFISVRRKDCGQPGILLRMQPRRHSGRHIRWRRFAEEVLTALFAALRSSVLDIIGRNSYTYLLSFFLLRCPRSLGS